MAHKITRSDGMLAIAMVDEALDAIWGNATNIPELHNRLEYFQVGGKSYQSDSSGLPQEGTWDAILIQDVFTAVELGEQFKAFCTMGKKDRRWHPLKVAIRYPYGDIERDYIHTYKPHERDNGTIWAIDPDSYDIQNVEA